MKGLEAWAKSNGMLPKAKTEQTMNPPHEGQEISIKVKNTQRSNRHPFVAEATGRFDCGTASFKVVVTNSLKLSKFADVGETISCKVSKIKEYVIFCQYVQTTHTPEEIVVQRSQEKQERASAQERIIAGQKKRRDEYKEKSEQAYRRKVANFESRRPQNSVAPRDKNLTSHPASNMWMGKEVAMEACSHSPNLVTPELEMQRYWNNQLLSKQNETYRGVVVGMWKGTTHMKVQVTQGETLFGEKDKIGDFEVLYLELIGFEKRDTNDPNANWRQVGDGVQTLMFTNVRDDSDDSMTVAGQTWESFGVKKGFDFFVTEFKG